MEISPFLLAKMLFVSFLFGIQAGIIFDALKALRGMFFGEIKSKKLQKFYNAKLPFSKRDFYTKTAKEKKLLKNVYIFVSDFLWVIYSFISIMIINYSYNNGGIRFFTIFAATVGVVVYYFTISKLIIMLFEIFIFGLKYTFFAILDAISLPFLNIYNRFVKKIKKMWENIRICIEKKFKKVYNVSEEVYKNESDDCQRSAVKIIIKKNQKKGCAKNENK